MKNLIAIVIMSLVGASGAAPAVGTNGVRIVAGGDWVPIEYRKEVVAESALDFSRMPWFHFPAGKFGRVVARGDHFEFAERPGVPARFYGVNLCNDANYPDHETARLLLDRISRLGYNAIRIHHHDKLWEQEAEKLDYLLAEGAKRGIYFTTDFYVSRELTWRSLGYDRDGSPKVRGTRKALLTLKGEGFRNWCGFVRRFLTHRNPYTGRTYAEEPFWIGIALVNEGQQFAKLPDELRRLPEFREAWYGWLKRKGYPKQSYPKHEWAEWYKTCTFSRIAAEFLADLDGDFVERAKRFIRDELGCPVPVSNCSSTRGYVQLQKSRQEHYDYYDIHCYRGRANPDAEWEDAWKVVNTNIFADREEGLANHAFHRLWGLPFLISEYNDISWCRYRGAGGLRTGAEAALQDWGAVFRFAYAHSTRSFPDRFVKASSFDIATDPVFPAADRAALMLFLRGDVSPIDEKLALVIDDAAFRGERTMLCVPKRWREVLWRMRTGSCLPGHVPEGVRTLNLTETVDLETCPIAAPERTDVRIDSGKGTFRVDTPRTQGGFVPEGMSMATADFAFDVDGGFASVWASSLDGRPLRDSSRILVSHVTDVQSEGVVYRDDSFSVILDRAKDSPRKLLRRGTAHVTLKLAEPSRYGIFALATDGSRIRDVAPESVTAEALVFRAEIREGLPATMNYEIVKRTENK